MNWIKYPQTIPEYDDLWTKRFIVFGTPACGHCGCEKDVREAKFRDGGFEFGEYDCFINVTHWMPMPLPPEE